VVIERQYRRRQASLGRAPHTHTAVRGSGAEAGPGAAAVGVGAAVGCAWVWARSSSGCAGCTLRAYYPLHWRAPPCATSSLLTEVNPKPWSP